MLLSFPPEIVRHVLMQLPPVYLISTVSLYQLYYNYSSITILQLMIIDNTQISLVCKQLYITQHSLDFWKDEISERWNTHINQMCILIKYSLIGITLAFPNYR